jgi:hypothetical protein
VVNDCILGSAYTYGIMKKERKNKIYDMSKTSIHSNNFAFVHALAEIIRMPVKTAISSLALKSNVTIE